MNALALLLACSSRRIRLRLGDEGVDYEALRGQLTDELRSGIIASKPKLRELLANPAATARAAWTCAMDEIAQAWEAHAAQARAAGREPVWLDDARDLSLQADVGSAIRAGELDAALAATNAWRRAWLEVIKAPPAEPAEDRGWVEIDSSVLGEHVLVATTPEAVPVAQAARPALVVYAPAEIEHLHGIEDATILKAVHTAKKALGARALDPRLADRLVAESAGRRPPPNPGVRAMLERGHGRFGFRAQAERSLTVWLRLHRPEVAEFWPAAALDASWLDWRQRLGPEHVATLDAGLRMVSLADLGHHMPPRPCLVGRPASSPAELTGQTAPERRHP